MSKAREELARGFIQEGKGTKGKQTDQKAAKTKGSKGAKSGAKPSKYMKGC